MMHPRFADMHARQRRRDLADTAARWLLICAAAATIGLIAAMYTRAAEDLPALMSTAAALQGM